tara:strand:- start:402 stop:1115 length:714 start_codon:yes stop_codon:yes gene_type:complete
MAYGIEATTASGGFIIDSNTSSTEYLTVVASSTQNANTPLTKQAGDLIFAKPFNTSSTSQNRVIYDTVTSQTSIKFYYKVFYVHLRKAQSISTSGTYGIQIKNNSNVVIFDSRSATSGMKIIGGSSGHAAAMQAGNTTGQAPVGSPILSVSGNSTIIHSGDPTNVYVSCNTGYYNVGAFGQQGNHVVIGGAVYDYSNNRIIAETYAGALVSGFGFVGTFQGAGGGKNDDLIKGELVA